MGVMEEELDETLFWLEFAIDLSGNLQTSVEPLHKEGNELLPIIVSSIITAKKRK
jgi:hypothetical protein